MKDDPSSRVLLELVGRDGDTFDLDELCLDADYEVSVLRLRKVLRYDSDCRVDGCDYVLTLQSPEV